VWGLGSSWPSPILYSMKAYIHDGRQLLNNALSSDINLLKKVNAPWVIKRVREGGRDKICQLQPTPHDLSFTFDLWTSRWVHAELLPWIIGLPKFGFDRSSCFPFRAWTDRAKWSVPSQQLKPASDNDSVLLDCLLNRHPRFFTMKKKRQASVIRTKIWNCIRMSVKNCTIRWFASRN